MNVQVESAIWYTKSTLLLVSLVWLIFMLRHIQVQNIDPYKDYEQFDIRDNRNHGLVYMKKMSEIIDPSEPLQYFDLLYFGVKDQPGCENSDFSKTPILILAANFKEVSDSYLAFYKEIQNMGIGCPPPVYSLKRREHLLLNNEALINKYVREINEVIAFFTKKENKKLSILTYQEGSVLLLKSFTSLGLNSIEVLYKVVLINTYNVRTKFLYESSYKYLQKIKQKLQSDPPRLRILNKIRIIFLNTNRYWDPSDSQTTIFGNRPSSSKFQQKYYRFLFEGGKKLENSIFLESRYMKSVFSLIQDYEYFTIAGFTYQLASFYIFDITKKFTLQQIQYFFYYGDLYGVVDHDLSRIHLDDCLYFTPSMDMKQPKHLAAYCAVIDLSNVTQIGEQSGKAILIYGPISMMIYSENRQKLHPAYQISNQSYYVVQKLSDTKRFNVVNGNNERSFFEVIPVYSPMRNKIPSVGVRDIFLQLKQKKTETNEEGNITQNKQQKLYEQNSASIQHALVTLCPHGHKLLYPLHFQRRNLYIFANKVQSGQNSTLEYNCYGDVSQFSFMPENFLINWDLERNIIFFTLICGFVNKKKIFQQYFIHLGVNIMLTILSDSSEIFFINFILLGFVILLQKFIEIAIFLIYFLQEYIEIRYQRLMLLLPIAISIIKAIVDPWLETYQISPWKILCLCLVFVVNQWSIVILIGKLYFLGEIIVYNHPDIVELSILILWLHQSLGQRTSFMGRSYPYSGSQKRNRKNEDDDWDKISKMDIFLVGAFAIFINGPSVILNHVLNIYIIGVCLTKGLNSLRQI